MSNITYPCPDYTLSDLQKVDDTKAYCSTCKKNVYLNNPGADVYCGTEKASSQYLSARQFTMRFLVVLVLGFGPSLFSNLNSQSSSAEITISAKQAQKMIRGTVSDKESGELLPFVNITLEHNGVIIAATTTDFDGNYILRFDDKSYKDETLRLSYHYLGYKKENVELKPFKQDITTINTQLQMDDDFIMIGIIISEPPLFDRSPDGLRQTTIKREDIQKMPVGR